MRKVIGHYKFREDQRSELVKHGILPAGWHSGTKSDSSYKFTVDQYMRMAEVGILAREDKVELVDGVILEMAPIGRPHELRVNRLVRLFIGVVPENVEVSIQGTIHLNDMTGPEPDIALLTPEASLDEENIPHPNGVLLVVEVAGSSLRRDRGDKARRYAQNGIPELWIFVLETDEVEVHRQPTPEGYADVQVYRRGDTLTIGDLPGINLLTDELLQ